MPNSSLETDCLSVQARLEAGDDFLLLDCREADEFETARIEGAVLLPMSEMQQRAGELAVHVDRDIVVYCHHGQRSLMVANWLRNQGFPRTVSLQGGIDAWSQQIDPAVPRY